MNNKRYIRQEDFNNSLNGYYGWDDGYYGWDDGDYVTYVNREFVGLYTRYCFDELRYHIR